MEIDLDKMKQDWVGHEFDSTEFEINEAKALEFAVTCGETEARYLDPGHEDFQAAPTFTAHLVGGRVMPKDFPRIGQGQGFDAGKCVTSHAPVPVGEQLIAKSQIADIYEKTGRSGQMIFIVHRMEFSNTAGELLSTVDWRLVQQPKAKIPKDRRGPMEAARSDKSSEQGSDT